MNDTILDFIRHGKPTGNSTYRGNGIDDPLSEEGWSQMWGALHGLSPWDQVITSPMARCHEFARCLSEKYGIPLAVENRFREVGFGEWEGCTREQIQDRDLKAYEAFYQDPYHNRPPGAEPLGDFFQRVSEAFEELIDRYSGQHMLVVGHAGVIRGVMAHVLQIPPVVAYRVIIGHAGITRIRNSGLGVNLEFHNRSRL
ncbi:histidine phosphatase family protein [Kaarinaea lacus]